MTTGRRMRARRWASLVVVASFLFPVGATASHLACDGTPAAPCPEFRVDHIVQVTSTNARSQRSMTPITGAPSAVQYTFAQTDQKNPVMRVDHVLPRGWNFPFGQLQAEALGLGSDGLPAARCEDLYDAGSPRRLARGELLSAAPRMTIRYNTTDRDGNPVRSTASYRVASGVSSNVSFRSWDEQTGVASLCVQYVTTASIDASLKDIIIPVTMTRVVDDAALGWIIRIDQRPVVEVPAFQATDASITSQTFELDSITGGNHHRDPDTKERTKIPFNRAPDVGINGRFDGRYVACKSGLDFLRKGLPCRNGETLALVKERIIPVTPAPEGPLLDFAVLLGPTGLGGGLGSSPSAAQQYQGYGLVRGSKDATVTWRQPALPPDTGVRGYLLAIAKPGQPQTMWFHRYITDPTVPSPTDEVNPCGPDGTNTICSVTLRFPLNGYLHGDRVPGKDEGIYDVALITIYGKIYQGDGYTLNDGRRSDGRCDDGTVDGAWCDPTVAPPVLRMPGASYWQFGMRARRWTLAFIQKGDASTPSGGIRRCSCSPHFLLLVDFANNEAEFTLWTAEIGGTKIGDPPPTLTGTYEGRSGFIEGDDNVGGTIAWGGTTRPISFNGVATGSSVNANIIFYDMTAEEGMVGRVVQFRGSRVS